jgi:hypothetical protein
MSSIGREYAKLCKTEEAARAEDARLFYEMEARKREASAILKAMKDAERAAAQEAYEAEQRRKDMEREAAAAREALERARDNHSLSLEERDALEETARQYDDIPSRNDDCCVM